MEEIKKFIAEKITELQPYVDFNEETKLLQEDILDSVSVLVLVQDLEEAYHITVDVKEITESSFETVNKIAEFIFYNKL